MAVCLGKGGVMEIGCGSQECQYVGGWRSNAVVRSYGLRVRKNIRKE